MIPYINIAAFHIAGMQVHAFGLLAATAVAVGYLWMVRRARRTGLDVSLIHGLAFWMFAIGFPASVVAKWLYTPEVWQIVRDSPQQLLQGGVVMSSFGGMIGGLAAGVIYLWSTGLRGARLWAYIDVIGSAFPRAFIFGRIGCSIAHDHPGIHTTSWLGVQYPGGARYDLGLLEVFFLAIVIAVLSVLERRPRPAGFFFGFFITIYGVFRLALDRLHEDAPRYAGITLDQWFSALAIVGGIAVLVMAGRRGTPAAGPPSRHRAVAAGRG